MALQTELVDINKRLRENGELSEVDLLDSEILASETKTELDEVKNSLSKKLSEISYYTNKDYDLNSLKLSDFPSALSTIPVDADGLVKLSAEVMTFLPEQSF